MSKNEDELRDEEIMAKYVDPEDERNMPNYSERLTPDDWGDRQVQYVHEARMGLLLAFLIFLCGIAFGYFFAKVGVLGW